MPIEGEKIAWHHGLIDGGCDEDVAESHADICRSTLKSFEGSAPSRVGGLTDLYLLTSRGAVEDIQYAVLGFACLTDDLPRDMLEAEVRLPEVRYVRRAVENRGEELEDALILEDL